MAFQIAREMPVTLSDPVIAPWLKVEADAFPGLTLRRLEVAARTQYAAGLHLLGNPWVASAADIHVRGLLELMAKVGSIIGKAEPTAETPRCGALCVERAIAGSFVGMELGVQALAPLEGPPSGAAKAAKKRARLDNSLAAEGLQCGRRRVDDVRNSLEVIRKNQGLPRWFDGLERDYNPGRTTVILVREPVGV